MMNPFIASLMQQAEQASKDALARQEQGSNNMLGMAMMMGGGFGGGNPGGGIGGGGIGGGGGMGVPSLGPTPAAYSPPTGTFEPTYTPPPPPVAAPAPSVLDAPAIAPTAPAGVAPLTADATVAAVLGPQKSAADVAADVLGVPPIAPAPAPNPSVANVAAGVLGAPQPMGMLAEKARMNAPQIPPMVPPTPPAPMGMLEEKARMNAPAVPTIVPDGLTVPDASFTAQKAAFVPQVPSISPVTWDTTRASLAGVDPNIIQAFEEAANAVNAAGGTYVPTLEMWSGADNHSRNHAGHAADIGFLTDQGAALAWDDPWVQDWTVEAARRGMRQLGAGPAYMKRYSGDIRNNPTLLGGDRIHAGGITPGLDSNNRVRVWSDSDADWGNDYTNGISGQADWLSRLNAAIKDPVALGTPIPAMTPQEPWWNDTPMGGDKVGVDEIAGLGGPASVAGDYSMTGDPMRDGILAAANELQMDPVVLATIISYETGGTMDPLKRGPTTQWGQHRGLIQFGEPQAKQHGVDFTSAETALASQLGANGAVVDYFRSNGWKPGMSELDAYSIVNAGGPGLYDRSDANNGGAPGTVRDKVEQQFGYHRDAARKLFRQMYAPEVSPRPQPKGAFDETLSSPAVPSIVPSTQAGSVDPNWTSPYNNKNMAMVGGVKPGGGLWHDWGSGNLWAHGNQYDDYSQFYREFTYEPKQGYVPVGERDGRTVYAAPAPEYINGNPVSREDYWTEARNRGALIPTESEMRALYAQAQAVPMPTIPNGGGPNDRISFDNVPDGPWYGPKEFYRTNDSPALPIPPNLAEAIQSNPAILAQILYGGM